MKPLLRLACLLLPLALSACAVAPSYDDLGGYGGYGGSPVYPAYPAYEYAPAPVYVGPSFFYSSGRPYPVRPYRRDDRDAHRHDRDGHAGYEDRDGHDSHDRDHDRDRDRDHRHDNDRDRDGRHRH
ncbi:MAG TPA: hypothetical protein VN028_09775 [Rhodocyclaceae bacterium]|nr:hypothetical protein [Rhodocyclaceae bacterium]